MPHHHHKPFESLGPVNWADINPNSEEALPTLLTKTFADTQTLIESIPDLPSSKTTGRARSATEGAAGAPHHITTSHGPAGGDDATAAKIKKDWKDVKVNAKDNPMNISVWKMSAKDGKGAWFARRSVHKGMGFERWKEGLEREFEQTLGVEADNPDDQLEGKIRGIGAERRVEDVVVEGVARLQGELTGLDWSGREEVSRDHANVEFSLPIICPISRSDHTQRLRDVAGHVHTGIAGGS